eukprot:GEZU01012330.1.p2 GENE.GEZU01012330.1~~GEZU01012330.1.p2  ORF type:complete len:314 (+),score=93.79 GEZU01012330.1:119-1060(+)
MKATTLFFLLVIAAGFIASAMAVRYALDDEIINAVNSDPTSSWKAGRNPRFEGVTLDQAISLLSTKTAPFDSKLVKKVSSAPVGAAAAPSSFDSRTQWPGCVHPIRNQEQCGSCWAFGATEALSDRFCIASNGKVNVVLSPQYLVSCDSNNYGCEGGYLDDAWNFLIQKGVPADSCVPYTSGSGQNGKCPSSCTNGSKMTLYKVKPGSLVQPTTVAAIQNLIMTSGPVEAAFSVYQDFYNYKSGVYRHVTGSLAGGHAIKIIGWGVDSASGLPYWTVANSWGTDWGMNGYFWILRGKDECGIEDNVIAGLPAL